MESVHDGVIHMDVLHRFGRPAAGTSEGHRTTRVLQLVLASLPTGCTYHTTPFLTFIVAVTPP